MRCINCPYNNIAKGIRLHDKIAIFVYSGKKFIQVRAFESNISLNYFEFEPVVNEMSCKDSSLLELEALLFGGAEPFVQFW